MEEFGELEQRYYSITGSLRRKLNSLQTTVDPDERASLLKDAEADIYEANNVLREMDVTVRHYDYKMKTEAQKQVKLLRSNLEAQESEFQQIKSPKLPATSGPARPPSRRAQQKAQEEQRRMLLEARSYADQSSQSLVKSTEVLDRTVETGITVSASLREQRDQIVEAREAVRETESIGSRARGVLRRMARRTVTNKLITSFIILLELGGVGAIVYYRWFR